MLRDKKERHGLILASSGAILAPSFFKTITSSLHLGSQWQNQLTLRAASGRGFLKFLKNGGLMASLRTWGGCCLAILYDEVTS